LTAEQIFRGRMILAPMARGTDLPFRRLATEWGAEVCLGEMVYAHKLAKMDRAEMPLVRRHESEKILGVQLAGKKPDVMAEAARIAEDRGADFVDVNVGCPINEVTRRGFGASLLRRAGLVGKVVTAMKSAVSVPVTVKLRLGWSSEKPTFLKVALAAQEGGADAIVLHPRSRAQRYRRPAEWDKVGELVDTLDIPVIGNGDIMTWQDARSRMEQTGCAGVMVGRWALAKPWLFREFAESREIEPDPEQRLAVVQRYVELCREYFGDDEKGRIRVRRFLVFHQDFFRRYRRGAARDAANAEDPRNWGDEPENDLERWLCRGDGPAVEALSDWLVDGKECQPPPEPVEGALRAVKINSMG